MAALSLAACTLPSRELGDHLASCENGECVCEEGFDECDGDEGTGCETDIANDPENCGGCGHRCHDGSCELERCLPATFWETTGDAAIVPLLGASHLFWWLGYGSYAGGDGAFEPGLWAKSFEGGEPVRLLGDDPSRSAWTVGDDALYWTGTGASPDELVINETQLDGTQRLVGPWPSESSIAYGFFADTQHLYLGAQEGLLEIDIADGSVTTLLPADVAMSGLLVVSGRILWAPFGEESKLHSFDLATHEERIYETGIGSGGYVTMMAASAAHAFCLGDDRRLRQIALDDGQLVDLGVRDESMCSMVADEEHAYLAACSIGRIVRIPLGGGPDDIVVDGQEAPSGLALAGSALYFVAGPRIKRLAL